MNYILVLGKTGSGKSTLISRLTGNVEHILESETHEIKMVEWEGKNITLVDTPGFDNTQMSNVLVLLRLCDWFNLATEKQWKISAVLYLHDITICRWGHCAIDYGCFYHIVGVGAAKGTAIVTTHWDLPDENSELREEELKSTYFKEMLDAGVKYFRYNDDESVEKLILDLASESTIVPKLQSLLRDGLKPHITSLGEYQIKNIIQKLLNHEYIYIGANRNYLASVNAGDGNVERLLRHMLNQRDILRKGVENIRLFVCSSYVTTLSDEQQRECIEEIVDIFTKHLGPELLESLLLFVELIDTTKMGDIAAQEVKLTLERLRAPK